MKQSRYMSSYWATSPELSAMGAQVRDDVLDVVDGEHDATCQRIHWCVRRHSTAAARRSLESTVAVRGPHHAIGIEHSQPNDRSPNVLSGVSPPPIPVRKNAFAPQVVDHDEDIVHRLASYPSSRFDDAHACRTWRIAAGNLRRLSSAKPCRFADVDVTRAASDSRRLTTIALDRDQNSVQETKIPEAPSSTVLARDAQQTSERYQVGACACLRGHAPRARRLSTFASSRSPTFSPSVMIDSGWNCTAASGSEVCSIAMTTPSSVSAVTCSVVGRRPRIA